MANEFRVKNGLIIDGNTLTSASVSASAGFFGTASNAISSTFAVASHLADSASYANFALSTSFALSAHLADSASYSTNTLSSSFALSAHLADSASYATKASTADSSSFSTNTLSSSFALAAHLADSASYSTNNLSSSYALKASNADTASYALNAGTASFLIGSVATASSLVGFAFDNTSSVAFFSQSQNIITSRATGSFQAAFFDYAAYSASNIRAGTVFAAWISGSSSYAEYSTVDIGNTLAVTMSVQVTSTGLVQLLCNPSASYSWSIKAIGRYIA